MSAEVPTLAQTPPRNLSWACGIAGVQDGWHHKGNWETPLGSEVSGVDTVDPRGVAGGAPSTWGPGQSSSEGFGESGLGVG